MSHTILLVEDEPTTAKLVKMVLQKEGYHVVTADNGPLGLRLATECAPDLVLLDIVLPGMDGFEVCRYLRRDAQTAHLPVIMFTSLDRPADQRHGFAAGGDDYIVKPVRREELLDKVRGALFFTAAEAPMNSVEDYAARGA